MPAETTTPQHAARAIALMAEKAKFPAAHWRVADPIVPTLWYDWADPATGRVGQCCALSLGGWFQAPLGEAPVVLEFSPARRATPTGERTA